ncbi:MAG: diaminopimelate epimerase [Verrucomicrobia bacterium]|jgi:diaminopimelate epimerase|nr:MAG: diaminopimelate epimerase [Verrucomicrobiota bacterium]
MEIADMEFWKMNGAGNDFVVIDNRDLRHNLDRETIARICHRQRGVGADGLLAVEPPHNGGDYRFRYYNADGGEAEMCGNGARCFGQFIRHQIHGGNLTSATFETIAGLVTVQFPGNDVQIGLSTPHSLRLHQVIEVDHEPLTVHSVNTGVPHAVIVVKDLDEAQVFRIGRLVRQHQAFAPKGTNVNFMQILAPSRIAIRTYERGVEDETLACGTGMVASALVHHELSGAPGPVSVRVLGGDTLRVEFTHEGTEYRDVRLTGPAQFVFRGTLETV